MAAVRWLLAIVWFGLLLVGLYIVLGQIPVVMP